MASAGIVYATEVVKDLDISKKPFTLTLARPMVAVDKAAVEACGVKGESVESAAQYVQTMATVGDAVTVTVDDVSLALKRGKHFFDSASAMFEANNF